MIRDGLSSEATLYSSFAHPEKSTILQRSEQKGRYGLSCQRLASPQRGQGKDFGFAEDEVLWSGIILRVKNEIRKVDNLRRNTDKL